MRFLYTATVLLLLGAQSRPVLAGPLEPLQAGASRIDASLPCAPEQRSGAAVQPAALEDQLCRAVAVAVLGTPLMAEAAVALRPAGALGADAGLQTVLSDLGTTLTRGGPPTVITAVDQNAAWQNRMRAAVTNYDRVFHPGAGLGHLSLPPVPAIPWADSTI
jgi:hypothetical protein